jgi:hypothetical protein
VNNAANSIDLKSVINIQKRDATEKYFYENPPGSPILA